jgi:hypothetical protein
MIIVEIIALFCCGTFFGAAIYISIAQHPASLQAGVPFAAKFFPPMYNLAAPMQIILAMGGTLAGLAQWYFSNDTLWMIGAGLLAFVIPFTVIVLKPINDQLLNPNIELSTSETETLLKKWAPRHWLRSIASGLSFLVYLWASVSG